MVTRIVEFVFEMCKTWGAVLTGGVFVALLASWQLTGHPIPPKIGWVIIVGAILAAAFQVWNRQIRLTEAARSELQQSLDKPRAMRKAVYAEMGYLYGFIEAILNKVDETSLPTAIAIRSMKISTFEWAKSQPDTFYELPEAEQISKIYSTMEFIHANLTGPHLFKEVLRMASGFILAMEAAFANPKFKMDAQLFAQLSPVAYKALMEHSKEDQRAAKLMQAIQALPQNLPTSDQ